MWDVSLLNKIPKTCGVYLMKDSTGVVLYVGKATKLKSRVRSYFSNISDLSPKTQVLVAQVEEIDWIVTKSEKEALILECNLIKKLRPKYNVSLRDDKSYPYLRISVQEDYPAIEVMRNPKEDGALYYGPFTSAGAIREVKRLFQKSFQIRDCSPQKFANRKRPCLNFDLGLCSAPCVQLISKKKYRARVGEIIQFFKDSHALMKKLEFEMEKASKQQDYERALVIRDEIRAIEKVCEEQHVVSPKPVNQDVFAISEAKGGVQVVVLHVRGGGLLAKQNFSYADLQGEAEEILSTFLLQFYENNILAQQILVPFSLKKKKQIEEYLSGKAHHLVKISVPQRGTKRALLQMAEQNLQAVEPRRKESGELLALSFQQTLGLEYPPRLIEGFDISTLQGEEAVGSRVRFVDGKPDKAGYRLYKIREVLGMDDCSMMAEVLERRIRRGGPLPDLLVVDGGKGQLHAALSVLKELEIEGLPVISLAKERVKADFREPEVSRKGDRVFLPDHEKPVELAGNNKVLQVLQFLRDEAHRFAITFHKKRRHKKAMRSRLDEIPGLGPSRKKELLRYFGSVENLKKASEAEIAEVKGMSKKLAMKIYRNLQGRS